MNPNSTSATLSQNRLSALKELTLQQELIKQLSQANHQAPEGRQETYSNQAMCAPTDRRNGASSLQIPSEYPIIRQHVMARTVEPPFQSHSVRTPPARRTRRLNQRQEFILFVKLLFHFLETKELDGVLRRRAKAAVYECIYLSRMEHADYTRLQHAVSRRLRRIVGEGYWTLTQDYLDEYIQKRGLCRAPLAV